jgi:hypothetical protein
MYYCWLHHNFFIFIITRESPCIDVYFLICVRISHIFERKQYTYLINLNAAVLCLKNNPFHEQYSIAITIQDKTNNVFNVLRIFTSIRNVIVLPSIGWSDIDYNTILSVKIINKICVT